MSMNDSRLKWLFAVLCISLFTFSLGWWLHSNNGNNVPMCQNTDCYRLQQEGTANTDTVIETDCPTCPPPNQVITFFNSTDNETNDSSFPIIFVITPTYARTTQKADLTRLCQTLMHVKNLYWILVEDSNEKTPLVTRFLRRCRVTSVQLYRKTSSKLQPKHVSHKQHKNRGAEQRNIGLDWLKTQYKVGDIHGVVYFGDDDNTYDIQLFEEMRYTKKVSIWPVGLAGGLKAEGPVCKNGKVVSWHVGWSPNRKFPVDMAAFAVNLDIILTNPKAMLNPFGPGGFLEPEFLSAITTVEQLEARADDCTKVYVWHTQTKGASLVNEKRLPTDLEVKR